MKISINETQLQAVRDALAEIKNGAPSAMVRAINKTLTGTKTDAGKLVAAELNVTQSRIKEDFYLQNAAIEKIQGSFKSKGKGIPIIDFIGTRITSKGVSFQIKKSKPRQTLPGSFIAEMKSGHKGVFWRGTKDSPSEYTGKGKPIGMARAGYYYSYPAAWGGKYSSPIAERFSSSVEDVLGDQMNALETMATERYQKNLEHEADYILSKAKG